MTLGGGSEDFWEGCEPKKGGDSEKKEGRTVTTLKLVGVQRVEF